MVNSYKSSNPLIQVLLDHMHEWPQFLEEREQKRLARLEFLERVAGPAYEALQKSKYWPAIRAAAEEKRAKQRKYYERK